MSENAVIFAFWVCLIVVIAGSAVFVVTAVFKMWEGHIKKQQEILDAVNALNVNLEKWRKS